MAFGGALPALGFSLIVAKRGDGMQERVPCVKSEIFWLVGLLGYSYRLRLRLRSRMRFQREPSTMGLKCWREHLREPFQCRPKG